MMTSITARFRHGTCLTALLVTLATLTTASRAGEQEAEPSDAVPMAAPVPEGQTGWPDPELNYADPLTIENVPPEFFRWDGPRYLEPTDRIWHGATEWAIRQQELQSRRVSALSRGIDRTLSGETYTVRDNDSYLRLGFSNRYDKAGEMGLEPEARFRLELPTVEEKFRLVIESDPDDLSSLSDQQRQETLREDERGDTFTTGALRFLYPIADRWDFSTDIGARLRFPPEVFWRSRVRSDWALGDTWNLRVDQRFYYFNTDGWGERTWLGFSRPVGNWHFLASSEAQWVHKDRMFEVAQVLRLERTYSNRHYYRYRLGILGESEPNWQTTDYFADLLYRNRLYDDWLYGEIIPALTFPRDDSFKPNPSITFRIEMFFSGKGSL